MRARVLTALATVAAVPALFIAATAGPASAHVLKTVGPYHLLIGFGNEPTYAGAQNSVFLPHWPGSVSSLRPRTRTPCWNGRIRRLGHRCPVRRT